MQEPARKRQKASSRGRSLSELLPAPKNAPTAGGRRVEALGGGGGAGGGGGSGRRYDSDDDDEIVPGTEDRSGMVELRPGGQGLGLGLGLGLGAAGGLSPHCHLMCLCRHAKTGGMHLATAGLGWAELLRPR